MEEIKHTLFEIVMKLNGHVDPYGESNYDRDSLENLESLIELSDQILSKIYNASKAKDRYEASMKAIGERAHRYLSELDYLNNR